MTTDLNIVARICNALSAAPMELVNAGLIEHENYAKMLATPEIRVTYPSYPNTAGPRGGIGGQAITQVPCVVLIYEAWYVFVSADLSCYFCCRMSAEFQDLLNNGANPWTHRHHFIEKKEKP